MARIKSKKAVEPLIGMLKDKNSHIREGAAWILGEMKAEEAVGSLIEALEDSDGGAMAALALGKIGSEKALKTLIRVIMDDSTNVRRASAWALGKIRSGKAVKPLIKALKDEDSEVQMWAALALEKIDTPEAMRAVEELRSKINKSNPMLRGVQSEKG